MRSKDTEIAVVKLARRLWGEWKWKRLGTKTKGGRLPETGALWTRELGQTWVRAQPCYTHHKNKYQNHTVFMSTWMSKRQHDMELRKQEGLWDAELRCVESLSDSCDLSMLFDTHLFTEPFNRYTYIYLKNISQSQNNHKSIHIFWNNIYIIKHLKRQFFSKDIS